MINSSEQTVFVRVNRQVGLRLPRQLWKELESLFNVVHRNLQRERAGSLVFPKQLCGAYCVSVYKYTPYRLMMLQHQTREDHTKRLHFCVSFQDLCGDDENFLKKLRFSDEATFHISGKVNKQNARIWGTEKPHRFVENERDSPKTNVFVPFPRQKCMARTSFLIEP